MPDREATSNGSDFIATSSSNYMNQALDELRELEKGLTVKKVLEPGILLIHTGLLKAEFLDRIKAAKPVFTRHIHHVACSIPIESGTGIDELTAALERFSGDIAAGEKVAIQIRKGDCRMSFNPIDFKIAGDAWLSEQKKAIPEIKRPEKIISVFLDGLQCHMGLGTPEDNLSGWTGGMLHYRKSEDDISRAKFKLMEAIDVFGIDMKRFANALDLGAAPGGWTSVLLEHGLHVTAVDTGDMDPRLNRYPKYRIIKCNVSELKLDDRFDLLTSDISWNPKNTARLINNLAGNLQNRGTAVVTLKLMGDRVRKTIKEVEEIYMEQFDIVTARQLFHNRDEITLYLQKK